MNFEKSSIYFSTMVPSNIKNDISNIFRIRRVSLNEKYLGVPLLLQKKKVESFVHLLDNTKNRLANWKLIYLAPPGRTTMNQSFLGSLASQHVVVFRMPKDINEKMDSLKMMIWWGEKDNEKGYFSKGWEDITLLKDLGGLNIRISDILNLALLTKLAWRLVENLDDKRASIIRAKYFANSNRLNIIVSKQISWIWNGICTDLEFVKKFYVWEIGDGKSIHIWKVKWNHNMHKPPPSNYYYANMVYGSQLIDQNSITDLFDSDTVG